jgi:hypothetical protein
MNTFYFVIGDSIMLQEGLRKLAVLKQAIRLQRKATALTPMERMIQRIATRRLIKAFDEGQIEQVAMASDYLLVAALMGFDADKAFTDPRVSRFVNSVDLGIDWKRPLVTVLRKYRGLRAEDKEEILGKMYTPSPSAPAYAGGKTVYDPTLSVQQQIGKNTGAIVNSFKLKVDGIAKDRLKLHDTLVQNMMTPDRPEKSDGRDSNPTSLIDQANYQNNPEMDPGYSENEYDDAEQFVLLCLEDTNSPLSRRVRETALPHIKAELAGLFASNKFPWLSDWTGKVFLNPQNGMFVAPPQYANFKGKRYVMEYIFEYYRTPNKFKKIADRYRMKSFKTKMTSKGLLLLGSNKATGKDGLGSFDTGGIGITLCFAMEHNGKDLQSKVFNATMTKDGLLISKKSWAKAYGSIEPIVSDIYFINLKNAGGALGTKIGKLPSLLQSLYLSKPDLQKEMYPIMLTEQTFRRSLQAKKKNKHSNVPF